LSQYAVFVDLENAGCKVATLKHIIEKVKIRGDIFIGKVYGYTEHFAELNPILLQNTFAAVPSIRYGGRQKNNLDIQLVIDAMEVAYTNPLIDCICIVSGDSDYTPLVGKLKSMGKKVLGISRSECASEIFINACNEFIFLESVRTQPRRTPRAPAGDADVEGLMRDIERILSEHSDADGWLFASELKGILLRLRPDFSEKAYGVSTFGKILALVEQKTQGIRTVDDNNNLKVRLAAETTPAAAVSSEDALKTINQVLCGLRDDGFDRVNPSIIKDALRVASPGFEEKTLGFKKFSDLLKHLEKEGLVRIEHGEDHSLLVHITIDASLCPKKEEPEVQWYDNGVAIEIKKRGSATPAKKAPDAAGAKKEKKS